MATYYKYAERSADSQVKADTNTIKSCCTYIIISCFKVTYKYSYFTLLNRLSNFTQSKIVKLLLYQMSRK